MRLQQMEANKKQEQESILRNAEYEIAMKRYNLSRMRHFPKRKKMDQNAGMIWHPRGQMLLIALLKKYETMRGYLMEALFDEKMVGEDQWWSFLDLTQSGVKVIGALYSSGDEKE